MAPRAGQRCDYPLIVFLPRCPRQGLVWAHSSAHRRSVFGQPLSWTSRGGRGAPDASPVETSRTLGKAGSVQPRLRAGFVTTSPSGPGPRQQEFGLWRLLGQVAGSTSRWRHSGTTGGAPVHQACNAGGSRPTSLAESRGTSDRRAGPEEHGDRRSLLIRITRCWFEEESTRVSGS
jgi:hypothetical protein